MRWYIGDGATIDFWTDNWLSDNSLINNVISLVNTNKEVKQYIHRGQWDITSLSICISRYGR